MYSANLNEDMTIDQQAPFVSLLSVVLLNWNGGNEVIGCIEHVLAQTYQPIELVVVDNASTDGSREAICELLPKNWTGA